MRLSSPPPLTIGVRAPIQSISSGKSKNFFESSGKNQTLSWTYRTAETRAAVVSGREESFHSSNYSERLKEMKEKGVSSWSRWRSSSLCPWKSISTYYISDVSGKRTYEIYHFRSVGSLFCTGGNLGLWLSGMMSLLFAANNLLPPHQGSMVLLHFAGPTLAKWLLIRIKLPNRIN